jgi:hypothetical protein
LENKKEYWVLTVGRGLYLRKIVGRQLSYTKYHVEAERFETKEEALFFAYGDRVKRGDTCTQRIALGCNYAPVGRGLHGDMARYLKLEITSCLENNDLWHEKMNELMLKSKENLVK